MVNQVDTIVFLNRSEPHNFLIVFSFGIFWRKKTSVGWNFLFHNCARWEQIRLGKGFCKFREDEIFKVFLLTSRFISERQFERAKFLSRPTLVRNALLIQHSNFLSYIKCYKPAAVIYFSGFVLNFFVWYLIK